MLKYYLGRDLSERLHIPLSRWKRWSREFLPPDPLGGLQSGYARQYNVRDAFAVYLAGFLVSCPGFSIPAARRILHDLNGWLKRTVVARLEAAADAGETLPAAPQQVELIIVPVDDRPAPAFSYRIRTLVERSALAEEAAGIWQERYTEQVLQPGPPKRTAGYPVWRPRVDITSLTAHFFACLSDKNKSDDTKNKSI